MFVFTLLVAMQLLSWKVSVIQLNKHIGDGKYSQILSSWDWVQMESNIT